MMFSVRIVNTDHYLGDPIRGLDVCYSDFKGCVVKKVPVMRIYGATPAGQKTCMHVHGVFPYMYVPYDGPTPPEPYIRQFANSLDKALNVAQGRDKSNFQHVYKIALVLGIPFYGYHEEEQVFLKIYLYNPLMVKKSAELLLAGAIMNKVYQPCESHIPYSLQMFIDYNLYGMNMINVSSVKFRHPADTDCENLALPDHSSQPMPPSGTSSRSSSQLFDDSFESHSICTQIWDTENIADDLWLNREVERHTNCELEVDVVAADILNRLEVGANIGNNPGLVALWDDEKQRRRRNSESSQLSAPDSPDREGIKWTEAEEELQERLEEIIHQLEPHLNEPVSLEPLTDDSQLFPSTSSQVEIHHSQMENDVFSEASQETVILDENEDDDENMKPVICERSILHVVSSSESFQSERMLQNRLTQASQQETEPLLSQDSCLAGLLVALAEDDTLGSSQRSSQVASQIVALEEKDSILSQVSVGPESENEEALNEEHQETLCYVAANMGRGGIGSQTEVAGKEAGVEEADRLDSLSKNTDCSPNIVRDPPSSELTFSDDDIPQLDGTVDGKTDLDKPRTVARKRLGMLGKPVVTKVAGTTGFFSIKTKSRDGSFTSYSSGNIKCSPQKPKTSEKTPEKAENEFVLDLRSPNLSSVDAGHTELNTTPDPKNKNSKLVLSKTMEMHAQVQPHNPEETDLPQCEKFGAKTYCMKSKLITDKPEKTEGRKHDNIFGSLARDLHKPPKDLMFMANYSRPLSTKPDTSAFDLFKITDLFHPSVRSESSLKDSPYVRKISEARRQRSKKMKEDIDNSDEGELYPEAEKSVPSSYALTGNKSRKCSSNTKTSSFSCKPTTSRKRMQNQMVSQPPNNQDITKQKLRKSAQVSAHTILSPAKESLRTDIDKEANPSKMTKSENRTSDSSMATTSALKLGEHRYTYSHRTILGRTIGTLTRERPFSDFVDKLHCGKDKNTDEAVMIASKSSSRNLHQTSQLKKSCLSEPITSVSVEVEKSESRHRKSHWKEQIGESSCTHSEKEKSSTRLSQPPEYSVLETANWKAESSEKRNGNKKQRLSLRKRGNTKSDCCISPSVASVQYKKSTFSTKPGDKDCGREISSLAGGMICSMSDNIADLSVKKSHSCSFIPILGAKPESCRNFLKECVLGTYCFQGRSHVHYHNGLNNFRKHGYHMSATEFSVWIPQSQVQKYDLSKLGYEQLNLRKVSPKNVTLEVKGDSRRSRTRTTAGNRRQKRQRKPKNILENTPVLDSNKTATGIQNLTSDAYPEVEITAPSKFKRRKNLSRKKLKLLEQSDSSVAHAGSFCGVGTPVDLDHGKDTSESQMIKISNVTTGSVNQFTSEPSVGKTPYQEVKESALESDELMSSEKSNISLVETADAAKSEICSTSKKYSADETDTIQQAAAISSDISILPDDTPDPPACSKTTDMHGTDSGSHTYSIRDDLRTPTHVITDHKLAVKLVTRDTDMEELSSSSSNQQKCHNKGNDTPDEDSEIAMSSNHAIPAVPNESITSKDNDTQEVDSSLNLFSDEHDVQEKTSNTVTNDCRSGVGDQISFFESNSLTGKGSNCDEKKTCIDESDKNILFRGDKDLTDECQGSEARDSRTAGSMADVSPCMISHSTDLVNLKKSESSSLPAGGHSKKESPFAVEENDRITERFQNSLSQEVNALEHIRVLVDDILCETEPQLVDSLKPPNDAGKTISQHKEVTDDIVRKLDEPSTKNNEFSNEYYTSPRFDLSVEQESETISEKATDNLKGTHSESNKICLAENKPTSNQNDIIFGGNSNIRALPPLVYDSIENISSDEENDADKALYMTSSPLVCDDKKLPDVSDVSAVTSTKTTPRRPSSDSQNYKADMSEVDFSVLEMMDGDSDAEESATELRQQLHTPPLVIQSEVECDEVINDSVSLQTQSEESVSFIAETKLNDSLVALQETSDSMNTSCPASEDVDCEHTVVAMMQPRLEYQTSEIPLIPENGHCLNIIEGDKTSATICHENTLLVNNTNIDIVPDNIPKNTLSPKSVSGEAGLKLNPNAAEEKESELEFVLETRSKDAGLKRDANENLDSCSKSTGLVANNSSPPNSKRRKVLKVNLTKLALDSETVNLRTFMNGKYYVKTSCECFRKKLASDIPSENLNDPLWEAQRERLAELRTCESDDRTSCLKKSTTITDVTTGGNKRKRDSDKDTDSSSSKKSSSSGKKKTVSSLHKRLERAFLSTKRTKKKPSESVKFLSCLSLLHDATVQNLNGSPDSDENVAANFWPECKPDDSNLVATQYNDGAIDDYAANFDDVMFKMSYLSPVPSENGRTSPPRPSSPCAPTTNTEVHKTLLTEAPLTRIEISNSMVEKNVLNSSVTEGHPCSLHLVGKAANTEIRDNESSASKELSATMSEISPLTTQKDANVTCSNDCDKTAMLHTVAIVDETHLNSSDHVFSPHKCENEGSFETLEDCIPPTPKKNKTVTDLPCMVHRKDCEDVTGVEGSSQMTETSDTIALEEDPAGISNESTAIISEYQQIGLDESCGSVMRGNTDDANENVTVSGSDGNKKTDWSVDIISDSCADETIVDTSIALPLQQRCRGTNKIVAKECTSSSEGRHDLCLDIIGDGCDDVPDSDTSVSPLHLLPVDNKGTIPTESASDSDANAKKDGDVYIVSDSCDDESGKERNIPEESAAGSDAAGKNGNDVSTRNVSLVKETTSMSVVDQPSSVKEGSIPKKCISDSDSKGKDNFGVEIISDSCDEEPGRTGKDKNEPNACETDLDKSGNIDDDIDIISDSFDDELAGDTTGASPLHHPIACKDENIVWECSLDVVSPSPAIELADGIKESGVRQEGDSHAKRKNELSLNIISGDRYDNEPTIEATASPLTHLAANEELQFASDPDVISKNDIEKDLVSDSCDDEPVRETTREPPPHQFSSSKDDSVSKEYVSSSDPNDNNDGNVDIPSERDDGKEGSIQKEYASSSEVNGKNDVAADVIIDNCNQEHTSATASSPSNHDSSADTEGSITEKKYNVDKQTNQAVSKSSDADSDLQSLKCLVLTPDSDLKTQKDVKTKVLSCVGDDGAGTTSVSGPSKARFALTHNSDPILNMIVENTASSADSCEDRLSVKDDSDECESDDEYLDIIRSMSPPRSPTPPPRTPSPMTSDCLEHTSPVITPAVIPLTIEDPEIQAEVEKARRVTLSRLVGKKLKGLKPRVKTGTVYLRKRRSLKPAVREETRHDKPSTTSETLCSSEKEQLPCNRIIQTDRCSKAHMPLADGAGTETRYLAPRKAGGEDAPSKQTDSGINLPIPGFSQTTIAQTEGAAKQSNDGKHDKTLGPSSGQTSDGNTELDRSIILKPGISPPTSKQIEEEHGQCGLTSQRVRPAYCSDPHDIPDKPREVGGRVLRVQSCMVSDLANFEGAFHNAGLEHGRGTLAAYAHKQSEDQENTQFEIFQDIATNVHLKAAAVGERNIIITPCVMPPKSKSVELWLKEKHWYYQAKRQNSEAKRAHIKHTMDDVEEANQNKNSSNLQTKLTQNPKAAEIDSFLTTPSMSSSKQTKESPTASCHNVEDGGRSVSPKVESVYSELTVPCLAVASTPLSNAKSKRKLSETDLTGDDQALTFTPILKTQDTDIGDVLATPACSNAGLSRSRSSRPGSSLRRRLLTSQMKEQFSTPFTLRKDISGIEGPTLKNTFGFKLSQQNIQDAKAVHEYQYLTVLSVELHIMTRGNFKPDPSFDSIAAIFYSVYHDCPPDKGQRNKTGVIVVDAESASQLACRDLHPDQPSTSTARNTTRGRQLLVQRTGLPSLDILYVKNEDDLLEEFRLLVKRLDPDILVGYEIQKLSWGYIIQRAAFLNRDFCKLLSRLTDKSTETKGDAANDEKEKDVEFVSDIRIRGRIVLDLWRVLRHEVTLNIYTFENVAYHVLHRRFPQYPLKLLVEWFTHKTDLYRWKTLEYYVIRAKGNLQIIEQLDLVGQTSEFARVFGIEFYNVLSRGSQYRVESMMLRMAKPMDYIPVSPSVQQRARMKAPECIPLTLEPESKFYSDPVVVLDFQSLYPSIMIAYNYCFSTCLGKLDCLAEAQDGPFDFGCTSLNILPNQLKKLQKDITICPNGVAFVKQNIRKGILPRMVEDILKTRIMVKRSMKDYKDDKTLQRLLHARQLGLKLIANVTYGYTAASFSGRMPCTEVGDSVVRKARETLERAIRLVEGSPKWNARVVYGDTDSLFVLLKGRSKEEAFKIGYEMVDAVTADNPKPVKLKFEKVYLPCVLQTKKRYVGFMYETLDQKEPEFDAKGIETVRRDTCTTVSKILERSIKVLFTTQDISQVKKYVQRQCVKLMEGRVSLQDYIFAKEYRGMSGYRPSACVPALEIAKRRLAKDKQSEPRSGERVPYVIVYGTPGLPLIQLVREPQEVLEDATLRLNTTYYITKQILPPLNRMYSLMGVNVFDWYNALPRTNKIVPMAHLAEPKKGTISHYFTSMNCPVCEEETNQGICPTCRDDPQRMATILGHRIRSWESTYQQLIKVCSGCMGVPCIDPVCASVDCPIMHRVNKAYRDIQQAEQLQQLYAKIRPL